MTGRRSVAFAWAWAAVGLGLLAAACGHSEGHRVVLRQPTGPRGGRVEVYMRGQRPGRPFREMAILQVEAFGEDATVEDVVARLAADASELGCQGLVGVHVDIGASSAEGFGVCVDWLAPGVRVRRVPPPDRGHTPPTSSDAGAATPAPAPPMQEDAGTPPAQPAEPERPPADGDPAPIPDI